jgi:hypothetical protein
MPSQVNPGAKTTVTGSVIQNPATEQSSNPLAGKTVMAATSGTTTKVAGTTAGVIISNPA